MKTKWKIFIELKLKELMIPLAVCLGIWLYLVVCNPLIWMLADLMSKEYTYLNAGDMIIGAYFMFLLGTAVLIIIGFAIFYWIKSNIKTATRIAKVRETREFNLNWIGRKK